MGQLQLTVICRQVVFIKRYITVMEVLCRPAYCGLCRHVVFKGQASLYTVEMFCLWTESACHNLSMINQNCATFRPLGLLQVHKLHVLSVRR